MLTRKQSALSSCQVSSDQEGGAKLKITTTPYSLTAAAQTRGQQRGFALLALFSPQNGAGWGQVTGGAGGWSSHCGRALDSRGPAYVDPGLVEGKSGGKGLSQGPSSAGAGWGMQAPGEECRCVCSCGLWAWHTKLTIPYRKPECSTQVPCRKGSLPPGGLPGKAGLRSGLEEHAEVWAWSQTPRVRSVTYSNHSRQSGRWTGQREFTEMRPAGGYCNNPGWTCGPELLVKWLNLSHTGQVNPGRTDKLSENSGEGRSRDNTGSGGSEWKSSMGRGWGTKAHDFQDGMITGYHEDKGVFR